MKLTPTSTAERSDAGLSDAKRAVIEARLRGRARSTAISRRPAGSDGSEVPLSFAQQRLWFIDRLDPGSAAYNTSAPLRLSGALDVVESSPSTRPIESTAARW
jgi:hypothetical protein